MKMRNLIIAFFLSVCLFTYSEKSSLADRVKSAKPATIKTNSAKKINKVSTNSPVVTIEKKEETPNVDLKTKKENKLQLNFESASLQSVLDDIADLFDLVFISDEAIKKDADKENTVNKNYGPPIPPRPIGGPNKPTDTNILTSTRVTFRTYNPLTKDKALVILDLFLEIAGLSRIPILGMPDNYFRITNEQTANKAYVQTFIGVNPESLPDTGVIRYLYFLSGANVNSILDTVKQLKSNSASIATFQESNALIITDHAYNIKSLMKIVKEIDDRGFPEALVILKLRNSDASDAVTLFKSLQGTNQPTSTNPSASTSESTSYFSPTTKIIADTRTNSLILFGKKDAVKIAEDFIHEHIDGNIEEIPKIFHVEDLNWVSAKQMSTILNSVVQYGKASTSASTGNTKPAYAGEKFFSNMSFEAEPQGNRLIVRGRKEDYNLIRPIIRDLDQKQPQVAVEVLIVGLFLDKNKSLATRMRTPTEGQSFNFQTSPGFSQTPIQINKTNNSIVANLIDLATAAPSGATLLTLGKTSIWAIMNILKSTTNTYVVSNPFLVATNKYAASVSLGETRRITSSTISGASGGSTKDDESANLTVSITPQINAANNINLSIVVDIQEFISPNTNDGNKTQKTVQTSASVANGEVIALGGLVRNKVTQVETNVPILSRLPLIGNLFKFRSDVVTKGSLVIFMSPKIITTETQSKDYTLIKSDIVRGPLSARAYEKTYDPVQRYFFGKDLEEPITILDATVPLEKTAPVKKSTLSKKPAPKKVKGSKKC